MKIIKLIVLTVLFLMVAGCGSVRGTMKSIRNNTQAGIVYGASIISPVYKVELYCNDEECKNPDDYVLVVTWTKFSYKDGGPTGILSVVHKDFPNLNKLRYSGMMHGKNVPFAKVSITSGKLGKLLEIVSSDGDGKCYWNKYKRVGGTICPAYDYDYRKNFVGVRFSGK